MATLYVTSAREVLSEAQIAEEPLSGGIFSIRPGIAGMAEPLFAG
jgi:sugar lactone lactonase YvrE